MELNILGTLVGFLKVAVWWRRPELVQESQWDFRCLLLAPLNYFAFCIPSFPPVSNLASSMREASQNFLVWNKIC